MRVELIGELAYSTSVKAREQLKPIFEQFPEGGKCLFLCERLTRIDSTGFGVLIHFVRQVSERKGKAAVVVCDPLLLDLFRIAKFDRVMTVAENEATALAAFNSSDGPALSPREY